MSSNAQLFERACRSIPGGVNSPVRGCRSVGGTPRFSKRAQGPYVWDAEDKQYIDYVGSWGPAILGHSHPEVVRAVQDTAGALGYVDFNYVGANSLSPVQLRNAAGEFATAGVAGFKAALRASDWAAKGNFHASLANLPGPGVWPITMGTFVLLPRVSNQPAETARALRFLMWALLKGDSVVEGLSFVRLPDALQANAFKALSSVVDKQGRKLGAEAFSAIAQAG